MNLTQGGGKGMEDVRRRFAAFLNQIDEDFRIGFRVKDIAFGQQVFLDLLVVFNDAVVDKGNVAAVGEMRMRVALGGNAVRCPARVPHGRCRHGDGAVGQFVFQRGQLSRRARDVQFAALGVGNARGIIAAVLQTAQAFDDNRNSRTVSGITDNAAHGMISLAGVI